MKRFAFSLLLTLLIVYALSQSPQGITHYAVTRGTYDQLICNKTVGIRNTILQGYFGGNEIYSETHAPVSNANGNDYNTRLKSTHTDPAPHPRWDYPNTNASSSSNFLGLQGGQKRYEPQEGDYLNNRGWYASWWVGTEEAPTLALINNLSTNMHYIYRSAAKKNVGLPVRCLKDEYYQIRICEY